MRCTILMIQSMDSPMDQRDLSGIDGDQLAAVVNRFAVTTCSFLASFSADCEARLGEQEARMQRVETALTLMEQKLGTVLLLD